MSTQILKISDVLESASYEAKSASYEIWISSKEFSELAKMNRQNAQKSIKKRHWRGVHLITRESKREGQRGGGGREVLLSSLPLNLQQQYFQEKNDEKTKTTTTESSVEKPQAMAGFSGMVDLTRIGFVGVEFDQVPQRAREEAMRRLALIHEYHGLLDHKISYKQACGKLQVSHRTLCRWKRRYKDYGIIGLAPAHAKRGRKHAGIPNERIAEIAALYCDPRRPKLTDCIRKSFAIHPQLPNEKIHHAQTYKTAIHRSIEPVILNFFRSKGKWNDGIFPYVQRSKANLPALWLLNGDHKQCDFLVKYAEWQDEGKGVVKDLPKQVWKVCRPWLTAWQDVRSGAIVGWWLGIKAPTSEEVSLALRRAILEYGLPEDENTNLQLLMDNGRDFRSLPIQMALTRLNIDVHFSTPYHGQSKPIERFFQTFDDKVARFQNGYTGEKPENRPPTTEYYYKNPETLPDLNEASHLIASWLEEFHHTPNTQEKRSPFDLLTSEKLPTRELTNRESAWLLPSKVLKVNRGQVQLTARYRSNEKHRYHNKDLFYRNGQMVQVFYDPLNMDLIHIYEVLKEESNSGVWITDCEVAPTGSWLQEDSQVAFAHAESAKKEIVQDLMETAQQNAKVLNQSHSPLFKRGVLKGRGVSPAQIITEHGKLDAHYQSAQEKEEDKQRREFVKQIKQDRVKEQEELDAYLMEVVNGHSSQPIKPEEQVDAWELIRETEYFQNLNKTPQHQETSELDEVVEAFHQRFQKERSK